MSENLTQVKPALNMEEQNIEPAGVGEALLPVSVGHTEPTTPEESKGDQDAEQKQPCCTRVGSFMKSTACSIYVSHFLSAWGDRMWSYAVGLYLAELSPDDLRLVASYGFTLGATQVLLGAVIGEAVDRLPRLKVARTVLAAQNAIVAACAILVCLVFLYRPTIYSESWRSGICEAGIIILAVIGNLFSLARKISVEKDWISVICEGNSAKLAKLSSKMRAIDQLTIVAAPIVAGLLMTFGSMMISAIFIAGWNIASVGVEYALLLRIYRKVPALSIKAHPTASKDENESGCEDLKLDEGLSEEKNRKINGADADSGNIALSEVNDKLLTSTGDGVGDNNNTNGTTPVYEATTVPKSKTEEVRTRQPTSCCASLCLMIFAPFVAIKKGWTLYFSYDVKFAGIGLACVYMTVLGFDNITSAYAYSQGASQAVIAGVMSLSAVIGIVASFCYPKIRKCVGIERAGLVGAGAEILALVPCVLSVWLPGSPFNLSPLFVETETYKNGMTLEFNTTSSANSTSQSLLDMDSEGEKSFISLVMLMAGITAARFGLWTFDLAISQLLLERVEPNQRGVVNGVQSSLNMIMDMLKFVLVIAVPKPEHYGILIILSFSFICFGGISYSIYTRKVRGHFFHCSKICCCCQKSDGDTEKVNHIAQDDQYVEKRETPS